MSDSLIFGGSCCTESLSNIFSSSLWSADLLKTTSGILYVRASLRQLAKPIASAGGISQFLSKYIEFSEIFAPHFYPIRRFWEKPFETLPPPTNSGALGKRLAELPDSYVSAHPTTAFVGIGDRIRQVLSTHDYRQSSFEPISALATSHDFSMLLLGCETESPGFSTVHAAQFKLGLSQKHIYRFLLRWDRLENGKAVSSVAPESPGCSMSFWKFYKYYEQDGNLLRGDWHGVPWILVPSASRALRVDLSILSENGRFVDCGRSNCLTCRFRLY